MSYKVLAVGLFALGCGDGLAGFGVLASVGPVMVWDPSLPWPLVLVRAVLFCGGVMSLSLLLALLAWSSAALVWFEQPWSRAMARAVATVHLPVPLLGIGVGLGAWMLPEPEPS